MARSLPTDEQLQQNVLAELKWEPRVRANEIGVVVKGGVVTLSGWVDSYFKRLAAREAARHVHGVRAVADDIEVRVPSAAEYGDAEIAAAAVQVLEWNILVGPEKPAVTVSHDVVALDGQVQWQFEKEEAERVVSQLRGVRGVINSIQVRPGMTPAPAHLKDDIEDALVCRALAEADQIAVDIQDSEVVLRGKVRSWAAREEAEKTAWMALGVTAVNNQIVVEP